MPTFHHHLICSAACLGALGMLASCTPEPQQTEAAFLGVWQVEDIGGLGAIDYSPATIELHADGSINGNSSCNSYSGTYSTDAQQQLIPSELISTRRACAEALMNQEQRFFEALGKVQDWDVSQPQGQLMLMDASGALQILATRQDERAGQEAVQPRLFTFHCAGGESFTVSYDLYEAEGQRILLDEDELMFHDDQTRSSTRMSRLISASGARYGSGDLIFWEHAGEATVLQSEDTLYSNCRAD